MLSYLRRKLSDSDAKNSNSSTNASTGRRSGVQSMSGSSATASLGTGVELAEDSLLHELGYRNATDLQETVFGMLSMHGNV